LKPIALVLLFAAIVASLGVLPARADSGSGTVYKSIGPDGKVRYSDRPPLDGRLEKTMKFENLPASALPASAASYMENFRKTHPDNGSVAPPPTATVLYSATWCGYCRKAKAWLAGKGVPYQDIDIDTPAGMAAYARTGGGGVPVLQAKGQTVRGFSSAAYDAVFAGAH
jgi:glutaredoxin